jgi:hypothetical protein
MLKKKKNDIAVKQKIINNKNENRSQLLEQSSINTAILKSIDDIIGIDSSVVPEIIEISKKIIFLVYKLVQYKSQLIEIDYNEESDNITDLNQDSDIINILKRIKVIMAEQKDGMYTNQNNELMNILNLLYNNILINVVIPESKDENKTKDENKITSIVPINTQPKKQLSDAYDINNFTTWYLHHFKKVNENENEKILQEFDYNKNLKYIKNLNVKADDKDLLSQLYFMNNSIIYEAGANLNDCLILSLLSCLNPKFVYLDIVTRNNIASYYRRTVLVDMFNKGLLQVPELETDEIKENIINILLGGGFLPQFIASALGELYNFNILWIITIINMNNDLSLIVDFTDNKKNNTICICNDTTHYRPVQINYNSENFIQKKDFAEKIIKTFPGFNFALIYANGD